MKKSPVENAHSFNEKNLRDLVAYIKQQANN